MLANLFKVSAIEEEEFLSETRVLLALNKIGSYVLENQFRREARQFFEEFVNSISSTVAAISSVGQKLDCFCPAILISEDNHAPLQLFGLLSDGLLEKLWLEDSEVEACRAECQ